MQNLQFDNNSNLNKSINKNNNNIYSIHSNSNTPTPTFNPNTTLISTPIPTPISENSKLNNLNFSGVKNCLYSADESPSKSNHTDPFRTPQRNYSISEGN